MGGQRTRHAAGGGHFDHSTDVPAGDQHPRWLLAGRQVRQGRPHGGGSDHARQAPPSILAFHGRQLGGLRQLDAFDPIPANRRAGQVAPGPVALRSGLLQPHADVYYIAAEDVAGHGLGAVGWPPDLLVHCG